MPLIPILEIRAGVVARPLIRPGLEEEADPAAVARRLQREGATALHVVDVDGALAGGEAQFLDLIDVLMAVSIPVQVGGGLRTPEAIGRILSRGAARAVVGTAAWDEAGRARLVERFGDRLVVAVDLRRGEVVLDGRRRATRCRGESLLEALRRDGVARALVTDLDRAGTLAGPDPALWVRLAGVGPPLMASGGLATRSQAMELAALAGVEDLLVGRAVAEGSLSLAASTAIEGHA